MGSAQRYEQQPRTSCGWRLMVLAGAFVFAVLIGAATAHFSRPPQVDPDAILAERVGSLQHEIEALARQLRETEAALDACGPQK